MIVNLRIFPETRWTGNISVKTKMSMQIRNVLGRSVLILESTSDVCGFWDFQILTYLRLKSTKCITEEQPKTLQKLPRSVYRLSKWGLQTRLKDCAQWLSEFVSSTLTSPVGDVKDFKVNTPPENKTPLMHTKTTSPWKGWYQDPILKAHEGQRAVRLAWSSHLVLLAVRLRWPVNYPESTSFF